MDRKFFFALAAFTFLLLYLLLVYTVLSTFLEALAWAAILVVTTFPIFRLLRRKLRGRSGWAAAIMAPAVVLLLALPTLTVLVLLGIEVQRLFDRIQGLVAQGNLPTIEGLRRIPGVATILQFLGPFFEDLDINLKETVTPALQNLVSSLVERSQEFAKDFVAVALKIFVMVISLFFFFRDGERMMELFWSAIPLPEKEKLLLGDTVKNVLSAVIYGLFLTAFIQGGLAFLGYLFAGLPSPILLGALTTLAALVPAVGTALIWVPAGLYLLFAGQVLQGIFILAWGTLVVGSTDNFVRPYFISGRGNIPFLTVLLGVLGGLAAFGFVGMVAGPIILAVFFAIIGIYRQLLPPGVATPEGNPADPELPP